MVEVPFIFGHIRNGFFIGTKPTNQLVTKKTLKGLLYVRMYLHMQFYVCTYLYIYVYLYILITIYIHIPLMITYDHLWIPNPEKPLALSSSDFDLDLHQLPFAPHVDPVLALQNL